MKDLKQLKQIIELMKENDLTELELSDPKGERIHLKRGRADAAPVVYAAPAPAVETKKSVSLPAAGSSSPAAPAEDEGLIAIPAPMVGTFYTASSPEAKPFVNVGSKVTPDTVVCIIEAMKVFNEIKAEVKGTVVKVLIPSGKAVEYGQPLFMVKPD